MDWPKVISVVAFDPSPARSYHAARAEGSESCGTVPSFVTDVAGLAEKENEPPSAPRTARRSRSELYPASGGLRRRKFEKQPLDRQRRLQIDGCSREISRFFHRMIAHEDSPFPMRCLTLLCRKGCK